MTTQLAPGSTIGILGGGQLGRMLSVAASRLGYRCHIFEPGAEPPAGHVAAAVTMAGYDDVEALRAFAAECDVMTYEFENVPTAALDVIESTCVIRPGREALRIAQDRLDEKRFLEGLGIPTAAFAPVGDRQDLDRAVAVTGLPAILKTRRFGYDGKGQVRIDGEADLDGALDAIGGGPAILEGFVPFLSEVSVIAARGADGSVSAFDPGQNLHEAGILRRTTVPAALPARRSTDAVLLAAQILSALNYVGVLGLELFVTKDALIVNEFAPRVHNSGHWTQNGCAIDQFEQHIRAICGWPLGDGARHSDVIMENLIGEDLDRVPDLAHEPGVALHLYGKQEVKPGRKMGHANRVRPKT